MDGLASILTYGLIAPLGVICVFVVLVTIHELGHYAAGRFFGVGAEEFSIGFGPTLVAQTDGRGTRWSVRSFPLGGFVKFAGDGDATSRPDAGQTPMDARVNALAGIALWKRALVVAAGPVANIILAFVLFVAHYCFLGTEVRPALIGDLVSGSVAEQAGFQPLDQVLALDGRAVSSLTDLNLALETRLGQTSLVQVQRGERQLDLQLVPQTGQGQQFALAATGFLPLLSQRVTSVQPNSPAVRMGLRVGDIILGYDDRILTDLQAFADAREGKAGRAMTLHIDRQGQTFTLQGVPDPQEIELADGEIVTRSLFGVGLAPAVDRTRLGLIASGQAALDDLRKFSLLVFKLPSQFVNRQRSLDDLGGPVRIAEEVGAVVIWVPAFVLFMAGLLSLQLGILNLLPIPILDGGHLMLYAVEGVLRRPLPAALTQFLYRMGGAVLLTFFLLVTLNDIRRVLLP